MDHRIIGSHKLANTSLRTFVGTTLINTGQAVEVGQRSKVI